MALTYTVVIERDSERWYVARCPAIPGCFTQGRTRAEALENIREAIALALECYAEEGVEPSQESPETPSVVKVQV